MKKNYEITEKQLQFLEDFLLRKYPDISDETRIELVDHLISDFEATTENGNLSQYLSNELVFIRKFVFNGVGKVKKTYSKLTWQKFFSFFIDFKLMPYTILIVAFFFFISKTLNGKYSWLILGALQSIVMLLSFFFGVINKKKFRKLDEVKYMSAEIWLPYLLVTIPPIFEFESFLTDNSIIFCLYASFTVLYALAAYLVVRQQRKQILEKYKHLLN